MTGLQRKTNFSITIIRTFLEISAVVIGFYLGGILGLGTIHSWPGSPKSQQTRRSNKISHNQFLRSLEKGKGFAGSGRDSLFGLLYPGMELIP